MNKKKIHGEGSPKTTEYATWISMKGRCYNKRDRDYRHYGGRGIKVCPEWWDFETFLRDMGRRPSPNLTIDRIDNSGDYEPGNCRWATTTQQSRNRRNNRLNPEAVKVIRACYRYGNSVLLAALYRVHPTTIRMTARGGIWS